MSSSFADAVAAFEARIGGEEVDADAFFSAEPIFRHILDQGLYVERMNDVLRSVLDRTTRTNALLTAGTFMSLHSSECSSWILMEHRRKSRFLYLTPVHVLQSAVSGPGYTIDRYRVIGSGPSDQIGRDTRIERVGQERVEPKAVARKSAVDDIVDVITGEAAERHFSLRVSSKPQGAFQINFERGTGRVFGLTPVNPMLSNLTTIFDLLADVASPSSIECLEPFTRHDQHFIRWHATRSVFAIDEAAGRGLIERACADPHEQVRAAAAATLASLPA